jgi:hypothetical protein
MDLRPTATGIFDDAGLAMTEEFVGTVAPGRWQF